MSYLQQLLALAREYGLDRYEQVRSILARAECGSLAEWQAKAYLPALAPLIEQQIKLPTRFLPTPPEQDELLADGPFDIEIGTLSENGLRVGIHLLRKVRHILIAGATGTGKTVMLRNLIVAIRKLCKHLERRISIIVIDPKRDFSDLASIADGEWIYLGAGSTLRMGLQRPDGVPEDAYRNTIATAVATRAGLVAARVCLARMIGWLWHVMNAGGSGPELSPNWSLLLDLTRAAPLDLWASKPDYAKTLEQVLDDLTENTGSLFSCFSGLDLNRDIINSGKNVVIGMEGLTTPWIRSLLVDLLLNQVFQSRLHRYHKVDNTEVILIIDEADQFASRQQDECFSDGISTLGLTLKQGREFGIMAIVGVSVLNLVSPFILANTTRQYFFNQANAASIIEARRALLLPPEADQLISKLKPGWCLGRSGLASCPETMLIQGDFVPPHRGDPPTYDTHASVPSQRLADMPHVKTALDKLIAEHNRTRLDRKLKEALSSRAEKLLDLAILYPYEPEARLWARTDKPSVSAQTSARKQLEDRGLIRHAELRRGRANESLIEVSNAGYERRNKQVPLRRGRGGVAHRHMSAWITDVGRRRGYRSEIEWVVPDTTHPGDVAWLVDGQWHLFEVVVDCDENLIAHLTACLIQSSAVATVTVVAARKDTLTDLRKVIDAEESLDVVRDRIRYDVIETFYRELWP